MKKIVLFIVIFLLQSFPSFGSVDGKGIVCECLDCKLDHIDPSSYIPNNNNSFEIMKYLNDKTTVKKLNPSHIPF